MNSDECMEVVEQWQKDIIKHQDTDGAAFIAAAIMFASERIAYALEGVKAAIERIDMG